MIIDYFRLAFRNLKKRGIRSWLTMLGIFIGIAAVVSLFSLGQGLKLAITGQFASLDVDKLTITSAETGFGPPGAFAVRKLNEHDVELIERVNGVKMAIPRLVRIAEVEYNKVSIYYYVGNIPEDPEEIKIIYDSLNVEPIQGRLLTKDDRGKVVLGYDFTGERFGKPIEVGKSINIHGQDFEVVGILDKASTFTINSVIIMPEEDMKRLLDIGDEIDLIVAQVEDQDEILEVGERIEEALRRDRNQKEGEEDFSVQTPSQSLDSVNTILNVIQIVITGIALISLVVGGVGIMNTMYTSVLERRKEIGVMKAIGARNRDVLSLFLIESSLLGLAGGFVGAVIGISLAFGVASAAKAFVPGLEMPVTISWGLLGFAALFSLIVGAVSGVFPALQASRLRPVEALRS